jgi:hypothetical protein
MARILDRRGEMEAGSRLRRGRLRDECRCRQVWNGDRRGDPRQPSMLISRTVLGHGR